MEEALYEDCTTLYWNQVHDLNVKYGLWLEITKNKTHNKINSKRQTLKMEIISRLKLQISLTSDT